jgi:hypothetical protein
VSSGPAVDTAWGVAGAGFGPPVRFPFAGLPLVAVAAQGDAFYVWAESGNRLMAVRRREGTFGRQAEVASGYGLAAATIDAVGALNVTAVAPDGTVAVTTGTPEGGFSPPRAISPPGASAVEAAANGRGDLLVGWTNPDTTLSAAVKPAGAPDWLPAETVPGSRNAEQTDAALDDGGNALLAWTDRTHIRVGYRHVDGRWEPAARLDPRPVCCTAKPPPCCELHPQVGFDGRGSAVILWSDAEPTRTLRAAVRPPAGPVRQFEVVARAAAGSTLAASDLAVDPLRNAIAVWRQGPATATRIAAAAFDPRAPVITALRPDFSYRVSEPATVRLDIHDIARRPARRLGTLRSLGSSRAGRLHLSQRLAKRLSRRGRYRATITATTRGGRHPQPRSIDFGRLP